MKYKEIVCDYCHQKAIVPTLRKLNYCDKCKNSSIYRKKDTSSTVELVKQEQEVYDPTQYMYKKEIEEVLCALGEMRRRVYYLWDKARRETEYYTKSGDILLHKVEFDENMTDEERLSYLKKVGIDRKIRRGCKDSRDLLFEILCSLGLRDPVKYGKMAFDGVKKTKDFRGYLNSLRYDKTLFSNALRKEDCDEQNLLGKKN